MCQSDKHTCILDAIIKQANWDCSKMLEKVRRDIEDHALSIRESKLSEMTRHAKVMYGKLKEILITSLAMHNFLLDLFAYLILYDYHMVIIAGQTKKSTC
jgi:hypothetical protein